MLKETAEEEINVTPLSKEGVCRDPRWGRCYESYSKDTKIIRAMRKIIFGLQGQPPANSTEGVPFLAGQSDENLVLYSFVLSHRT